MTIKRRVLIIDDEPDFVEAFRRTLEARSFEVITAFTRGDGQEMARVTDPGLIVLGTLAPPGQAFSVYQWLRQNHRLRGVPLIVLEASAGDLPAKGWRRFEGLQLQADDYMVKPVEPAMLVPRIQSLIENARRHIGVLIADDHAMIRDGIGAVLALQNDIRVVGEATNGQEAVDKALCLSPAVVLMDIVMPVMSGLEATRQIIKEQPRTRILILTQYDEQENMLVAKQAGACGFVPKRAASTELVSGIKSVVDGNYFPASFAELCKN